LKRTITTVFKYWTYLNEDAVEFLVKKGAKTLLIDLPSIDKRTVGSTEKH
jgi:kynurenine formamidase